VFHPTSDLRDFNALGSDSTKKCLSDVTIFADPSNIVLYPMLRPLAVAARLLRGRRPSSCSLYPQTKRLYDIPYLSNDATARFARCSVPIRLLSSPAAAPEEDGALDETDMMDKSHQDPLRLDIAPDSQLDTDDETYLESQDKETDSQWALDETEMIEKSHDNLLTVVQLKQLCKDRGLFVSGRKAELEERLQDYILEQKSLVGGYRRMSGNDVKVACSLWGLDNRGTFQELCDRLESRDRLREHSDDTAQNSKLDSDDETHLETQDEETDSPRASDEMEMMEKSHGDLFVTLLTDAQLRNLCKERGLVVSGRKAELQERLQEYILEKKGLVGGYRRMSSEDLSAASRLWGISKGTMDEVVFRLELRDGLRELSDDKAQNSKLDTDEGTNLQMYGEEREPQKDYFDEFTVTQLKAICRQRDLKISGTKAELIDRLRTHVTVKRTSDQMAVETTYPYKETRKLAVLGEERGPQQDHFGECTVPQLKDICRLRDLKVSGTKAELLDRLRKPAFLERNSDQKAEEMTYPDQEERFCFDKANLHRLVPQILLERDGRPGDILLSPPLDLADETESLLALLPDDLAEGLADPAVRANLMEVVLDIGRRPFAWVGGRRLMLGAPDRTLCPLELSEILTGIGPFGTDNRAGLDGSLHRISAVRNRDGKAVGLTLRVGRHIPGNAIMIADLLYGTTASILFVGEPGSGKTSIVRDAARLLAAEKSVIIVDTSCEIGGAGDIPHECIGLSRRMQVKSVDVQAHVMVECVQNHTPAVMVIDEIGRAAEVQAALTCKERGVRIIASAHGDIPGLVRNSQLCDLVGGVETVIVGDKTAKKDAKRNGKEKASKLRVERRGPPIFDVIVELKRGRLNEWQVVLCSASAVDSILAKERYKAQIRRREESGSCIRVQSVEHDTRIKTQETIRNNALQRAGHTSDDDDLDHRWIHNDDVVGDDWESNGELTTDGFHLAPESKTCPVCEREFRERSDLVQHATMKHSCYSQLNEKSKWHLTQEKWLI
jgi:stage III sporulation protein SpoIIIAA